MKIFSILIILAFACLLWSAEYRINLSWDEFEGECNGFVSGTIGSDFGCVSGVNAESVLDGKLISVGEGQAIGTQQSFIIKSDDGYFSFWIKDKFADQEMNADLNLIARAKPVVQIFKNNKLIEAIQIPQAQGLTCKVFTLEAYSGEVDTEIQFYPKSKIILGKVVNAVSGDALADVNVTATNNMKETAVFKTDENGVFIFDADLGKYDLFFSKEGFISAESSARMGIDETPREIICAMSPEVKEFRIVLTWGSRPRDLDAHLSGPKPSGGNFHIWYRNRIKIAGRDFLDRDDTSSYGPETITIYKPAVGDYYYSVYDYSNKTKKRSQKLSRSNALVQVYGQNRLLATFSIPANLKGNCWHVFKIDKNHEIVPIDRVDFVAKENSIQ
ncbi:MAG: hypothetical protein HQ534_09895 [Armatimonadetes bacterium]|nr:hypothetical protein [Armatimonadota bacterium]